MRSFFLALFRNRPRVLRRFPTKARNVFPLTNVARIPIKRGRTFDVRARITMGMILLHGVGPVGEIQGPLHTTTFPRGRSALNLSPSSRGKVQKGYHRHNNVLYQVVRTIITRFRRITKILFLFLLMLMRYNTNFCRFLQAKYNETINCSVGIVSDGAMNTCPFRSVTSNPSIGQQLTTHSIRVIGVPSVPRRITCVFRESVRKFNVSPRTVNATRITASNGLSTRVLSV